jgi:hypothetical protein
MGAMMDLAAGDTREILLAMAIDDWEAFADRRRFVAHLSLGGGLDPIWLDLFAEAARDVRGGDEPGSFAGACYPLDGPGDAGDRTVERVDRRWLESVALLPHDCMDHVASRWIELIEQEERAVDPEEKPMLRTLAGEIVAFAREAEDAEDVLFAWSL